MFLPKVLRLRVAFAINNNLNMKLRNSNVVQLSANVQHNNGVLARAGASAGASAGPRPETEARNRGPK